MREDEILQVVFSRLLGRPLDHQCFLHSSISSGVSSLLVIWTGRDRNPNIPRLEYQTQLWSDSADSLGPGTRPDEVARYVHPRIHVRYSTMVNLTTTYDD